MIPPHKAIVALYEKDVNSFARITTAFLKGGMIFMIITEKQKQEIEQLIPKHKEALIAYGADMYRRGMTNGAISLGIGVVCGVAFKVFMDIRKINKENEKES